MGTEGLDPTRSSGGGGTRAARTIPELLLERVAATPGRTAFLEPQGEEWSPVSWQQLGDRVRAAAAGLRALGLRPGDRCALLSGTRLDWIVADLATLCSGGATTTIYPASTPEDCAFIINDSAAVVVFAENEEQVRKLASRRDELGHREARSSSSTGRRAPMDG